ncbi:MAG TPA: hypothetical protein P5544_08690 [Candidatus Nanopelagicales bacterium]|nr:hypothetical protein [Candidatus Nanopelagicales bacterium]
MTVLLDVDVLVTLLVPKRHIRDDSSHPRRTGTHYTWTARIAGITLEGLDVFTEFVQDRRITDMSSSALEGTWTYGFEPDGSGTRLTIENRSRSFWRIRPLEQILDLLAAKTHEPRFERMKRILENS